jgi:dTDP-4-dehydrorhamnose 3,5-epimerase-like enzyme
VWYFIGEVISQKNEFKNNAMSKLINIPTFTDSRGVLSVIEKQFDFLVRRIFYIYNVPLGEKRGGHGHFKTKLFLFALNGSCRVVVKHKNVETEYFLDEASKGLLLEPSDWHEIYDCENTMTLMVLASEEYDKSDYFFQPIA